MTMGDVSKLPKWAQHRITSLERELARMNTLHDEWLQSHEGDDTFWYAGFEEMKPIGRGETIRFRLGPRYAEYIDVCIGYRGPEKWVQIMGGDSIELRPQSGNYALVRTADRT